MSGKPGHKYGIYTTKFKKIKLSQKSTFFTLRDLFPSSSSSFLPIFCIFLISHHSLLLFPLFLPLLLPFPLYAPSSQALLSSFHPLQFAQVGRELCKDSPFLFPSSSFPSSSPRLGKETTKPNPGGDHSRPGERGYEAKRLRRTKTKGLGRDRKIVRNT